MATRVRADEMMRYIGRSVARADKMDCLSLVLFDLHKVIAMPESFAVAKTCLRNLGMHDAILRDVADAIATAERSGAIVELLNELLHAFYGDCGYYSGAV